MSTTGWGNFWQDQRLSFYAVMKMATSYFVLKFEKLYPLQPTDQLFDYGCGPGFVADSLATKSIQLTGADINDFFIKECRKNHPASRFLLITTDTATNKKILGEALNGKHFDYILLLSIIQYFKSANDLDEVIGMLRHYLKPQGKLIIADVLDENTSSLKDAFSLLMYCIKRGRIGAFAGFISYLLFSDYRKISKQNKLLLVSENTIRAIATRLGLHCEKVNGLTLQRSRSNYILSHTR
ncbi:MAG: class I SAM-dependent methyltransferase [Niastella sp.]|uniref:class I SAM-dependent methyltransferase n=1 Tax=Niastella sp. TaxID=1869183 RepID=UPI00389B2D8C